MKQNTTHSSTLFKQACELMPGGVNSPVRAFGSVGGVPRFIDRAEGCKVWDADGNEYIDYISSWGPALLGHSPKPVLDRVRKAVQNGLSFGAPTASEVELACLIRKLVPGMECMRMVNSGTEAVMSALRLARGYTKRDGIVKFEGCYHGHADSMLVAAGSGAITHGHPNSAGVPDDFAKHTYILPYNDTSAVAELFEKKGDSIAALIVEPIAANMGLILPEPGFLQALRDITKEYGALLIFDEVITGFRLSSGGAQEYFSIKPDLSCFGKIIGGGMPVGAYGGSTEIMQQIAPLGPVYQAGTLSGNPVAMAAGIATLEMIDSKKDTLYADILAKSERLANGLKDAANAAKIDLQTPSAPGLIGIFFSDKSVRSYSDAKNADSKLYAKFFHGMLERGFFFAPSAFEVAFISTEHDNSHIDATIDAANEVFKEIKAAE